MISEFFLLKLLKFDKSFRKDRASLMTKGLGMRGVRQSLPRSSFEVISEFILLTLLKFDNSFRKDRASRMTIGLGRE